MTELTCRITRPNEAPVELTIKIGDPRKVKIEDTEHHECDLQLGNQSIMSIGGVSPIDAMMNALKIAKTYVDGKSVNTVEWN
jgi:hypothetical protein